MAKSLQGLDPRSCELRADSAHGYSVYYDGYFIGRVERMPRSITWTAIWGTCGRAETRTRREAIAALLSVQ